MVNASDGLSGGSVANNLQEGATGAVATATAECARLREDLALSRRELAQVRLRQEDNEEQLAKLSTMEADRDRLAQLLARHLSDPFQRLTRIGGVRGWLARLLLGRALRVGREDPTLALIEASDLFDAGWYLRTYPDVAEAGDNPADHYLFHGAAEGRAASPRFDTAFYLARYPDVKESGLHPLVHYIQSGQGEGRLTVQPFYERVAAEAGPGRPLQP